MHRLRESLPALFALAIPTGCGIAWMATSGAPSHYPLVNAAALLAGFGAIIFTTAKAGIRTMLWLAATLVALMLVAALTGPALTSVTGHDVSRWLSLGPISLHSGMLCVPVLAVLAARTGKWGGAILGAATVAALLQPDAATGFAIAAAATGLHHATKDWRVGLAGIFAFLASLVMAMTGELPPQPFVERVFIDSAGQNPLLALALALSLLGSFALIAAAERIERPARFAIAGALFGFAMTSAISHYPAPLIGNGASAILGFALALAMTREQTT